jgi:hypothetical protein
VRFLFLHEKITDKSENGRSFMELKLYIYLLEDFVKWFNSGLTLSPNPKKQPNTAETRDTCLSYRFMAYYPCPLRLALWSRGGY